MGRRGVNGQGRVAGGRAGRRQAESKLDIPGQREARAERTSCSRRPSFSTARSRILLPHQLRGSLFYWE